MLPRSSYPPSVSRHLGRLAAAALLLWACAGCGSLCDLTDGSLFGDLFGPASSTIAASVTATAETGLPTTLSGDVSGQFQGTYREDILEVYFDATGAPIAALSRSEFTFDSPTAGTLVGLNQVVVLEPIVATDESGAPLLNEQGQPIVAGLRTSATGTIISGTGGFAGRTGELHTESALLFTGGDFGLGSVDSDLVITLDAAATN